MITIYAGEFNKEYDYHTFMADAYNFGSFDCDANGENGEEYLFDGAKEMGFTNNLDYWSHHAYHNHGNLYSAINSFMEDFVETWNSYCDDYEYKILELSNGKYQVVFVTYNR